MEFQTDHLKSDDLKQICRFAYENCKIWYGEIFIEEDIDHESCSLEDIMSYVDEDFNFRISINDDIEMGFYEDSCYCWFVLEKDHISNIASLV